MEEVAQMGCGGRREWSTSAEDGHSAEVRESGGGEWCGDVLRQGGGAAGLCIGDRLSVLLRDVASLLLREANLPKFCRAFHLHFRSLLSHHSRIVSPGNITSLLNIPSKDVKCVVWTTSRMPQTLRIRHQSHVIFIGQLDLVRRRSG